VKEPEPVIGWNQGGDHSSMAAAKPHIARASGVGTSTSSHLDPVLQHLLGLGSAVRFPSSCQLADGLWFGECQGSGQLG
jgi:hypothetical protein